jgi:hypothetical protein
MLYKGQRVAELLEKIRQMEMKLDAGCRNVDNLGGDYEGFGIAVADGYATLAIAKAKLSSLKGNVE